MSLQARIQTLALYIAQDIKALQQADGSLSSLTTTQKSSLVGAINEVKALVAAIDTSTVIDDASASLTKTYSSTKINSNINTAVTSAIAGVINASPAALDTLNEIAAALGNDANFSATVLTALGQRVAVTAQSFTSLEKSTARGNIDAASVDSVTTVSTALSTFSSNTIGELAKRISTDAQSFTVPEKTSARGNIDAASTGSVTAVADSVFTLGQTVGTLTTAVGDTEYDLATYYVTQRNAA